MTIKITWLGCAAYILDLDGTKLMFDPFFFRQKNPKTDPILKTKREDIKDISGIFISHGHIDHITDAGWFAENIDAPVYCSKTAKENIIRWASGEFIEEEAHELTEKGINNIKIVDWNDQIEINKDIQVEIIKSKHIVFDANTIFARLKSKEFWKIIKNLKPLIKLRAGKVLAFCIYFKDKKIISFGSLCHKFEDVLRKYQNCDIFITPLAGNSAKHLAKNAGKMVDILKPKIVIPNHWDNFWPPISRFEDLGPFNMYMEKNHPDIEVKMLNIDEEMTLDLD